MISADLVGLALVPRALAKLCGGEPVAYREIYRGVVDGLIDAQQINGRWFIRQSDLPMIAQRLRPVVVRDEVS